MLIEDFISFFNDTIPRNHQSNSASISTSSHHAQVPNLKLDDVLHLVGGQVQLDAIINLGIRVRIPDGPAVAGVEIGHTLWASGHRLHPAQLVCRLRGSDPVYCETSLHVVYDPKVFTSLVNLDNIHEAGGELGVGLGLSIDLDQTLLHDRLNLFHAQGILDSIP